MATVPAKKTWKTRGEIIPLFDRLVDENPQEPTEPVVYRVYSLDQVKASVLREVNNLLDTRLPFILADYEDVDYYEREVFGLRVGYPFFYGISDFSFFNGATSSAGVAKLEKQVAEAITIFEPRLKRVTVKFDSYLTNKQEVMLHLRADLVVGSVVEPVTFPIYVSNNGQ